MKLIDDDGNEHDFPIDSAFIVFSPDDNPALLLPKAPSEDSDIPVHALMAAQIFIYMHEKEHVEDIVRYFEQQQAASH